ncbi:type I-E CRISPR-associated protein Cas6/Cse3/CasE [Paenirhodobacter sp.]|uniref:type I-E CRISPR-associated protein Cas6/Cse3/CasE n=1 Tax=Paenirhodobacter sp. TaxID=1965326 RepID=UPI003B3DB5EB
MRDYILRVPAGLDLSQRTALKNAVAALFGDRCAEGHPRYLFSPDPLIAEGPWIRVRSCAGPAPEPARGLVAELAAPVLRVGQRIEAAAWVAMKARVFHAETDLHDRVMAGLARYRDVFAAAIDLSGYAVDPDIGIAHMERGRARFGRAYGRISLSGRVTDEPALRGLLTTGIGAAKAYGFGLIGVINSEDRV